MVRIVLSKYYRSITLHSECPKGSWLPTWAGSSWTGISPMETPPRQNSCRPDMISNLGAIRMNDGWFRVMYVAKFHEAVYVLHWFKKKANATSNHDKEIAKVRYKAVILERGKKLTSIPKSGTSPRLMGTSSLIWASLRKRLRSFSRKRIKSFLKSWPSRSP